MALIRCSNCGKEISDTTKKCIHCGAAVIKEKQKEKNKDVKKPLDKIDVSEINLHNGFIAKYIINFLFSFIFIFFLCNSKVIITKKSGDYSIMQFIQWLFQKNTTNYMLLTMFIFFIILLNYIFGIVNDKTRKISKIFYILLVIVEFLFILVLKSIGYSVNSSYSFIVIYTVIWLIYNFIGKEKLQKDDKNSKDLLIEDSKPSDMSQLNKLKELKELLDMDAISETEYQKMKEKILEKEFEKIK